MKRKYIKKKSDLVNKQHLTLGQRVYKNRSESHGGQFTPKHNTTLNWSILMKVLYKIISAFVIKWEEVISILSRTFSQKPGPGNWLKIYRLVESQPNCGHDIHHYKIVNRTLFVNHRVNDKKNRNIKNLFLSEN